MNVIIDHGDPGMSRITIGGSNFGFGPIQSSHVRGKVTTLRQRIEQMAAQPPPDKSRLVTQRFYRQGAKKRQGRARFY